MTIQEWAKVPFSKRDWTPYNKAWAIFSLCTLGHKLVLLHHLNQGCNDYELWSPVVPMFKWCHQHLHADRIKGRSISEETRQKLSESHIGQIPWNKGIPHSVETKEKIALKAIGRKQSIETCLKKSESHKNIKHSDISKQKISESAKQLWLKRKSLGITKSRKKCEVT
jgi:hypothetical protein